MQSTNYLLIAIIEVNPSAWKTLSVSYTLAQDYLNTTFGLEWGGCLLLLLSQAYLK